MLVPARAKLLTFIIKSAASSALFGLLASCTFVSDKLGVSYQNKADPQAIFSPTTPVPRASLKPDLSKDSFIGVAVSGGGSRAANFGMAVLAELEALGIMQHVDAISAVSGGSIPSAFYALHGTQADWAERGKQVASGNFLSAFLAKLINPVNFTATTFTDKDRTDLLAAVMNERVFAGANPLFKDLGAKGPRKPSVFFNATDTTNGGERFVFTDDNFLDRLGADLQDYPIAYAMASSGAFPGIFNSVTMRRYSRNPEVREQEEGPLAQRNYVHLIDGGSSDNLGVDTLTDLARRHYVDLLRAQRKQSACLIIVIDSHVPSSAILDAKRSDRRNPFSALIDLNFLDAIDAMLSARRTESLRDLGIRKELGLGRFNIEIDKGLIEYDVTPYRRVSQFDITYYEQAGLALREPRISQLNENFDLSQASSAQTKSFACTAWHVALEDIHAIISWSQQAGSLSPVSPQSEQGRPLYRYRAALSRVLKQLKTNYKLDGPSNCSNEFLQTALYDAAHIATREDKVSLDQVCSVMRRAGLDTGGHCKITGAARLREGFKVEAIEAPKNLEADEQRTNRFVRCPAP